MADGSDGLWVADSYNGKVKLIELDSRRDGRPENSRITTKVTQAGGKALSDPGGVWVEADGSLLIADTGNDRILRLLPGATEPQVIAVGKRAAAAQALGTSEASSEAAEHPAPVESLATVLLGARELPAGAQTLHLALVAPHGFEFSAGAPWSVALTGDDPLKILDPSASGEAGAGGRVELQARAEVTGPEGKLTARVHANICDAVNHAACYPIRSQYALSIRASDKAPGAPGGKPIELELPSPAVPSASGSGAPPARH